MPAEGPPTVETPRLVLRAPRAEDVDALHAIQSDARAMRHTFVAADRDATVRFLDGYAARFATDGFGPWTALLRHGGEIAGWGGLNRDPSAPQYGVEVSYFIHPRCWGRGLAGEVVGASLDLAFGDLDLDHVLAFTHPDNLASRRVLEKAGFRRIDHVAELERDRYRIDAPDRVATPPA